MMSKILIDCTIAGSGGMLAYYRGVMDKLSEFNVSDQEMEVYFLVNDSLIKYFDKQTLSKSIVVPSVELVGMKRYFWLIRNLKKNLQKNKIDLLFVPNQMSIRFRAVPQLLMFHNMEPFHFHKYKFPFKEYMRNAFIKKVARYSGRRAYKIIAVSNYVSQFLQTELDIDQNKLTTISHGIDEDFSIVNEAYERKIVNENNLPKEFLFTTGSFRPYRKYEDIIEAFFELKKTNTLKKDTKLLIAGDGIPEYKEKLFRMVSQSEYQKDVVFLGFVNREFIKVLYKRCKIFISTTEVEACPNIAIESLMHGCCIVAKDIPPVREIFCDAVKYYTVNDGASLSDRIEDFYGKETLMEEFKNRALQRSRHYAWNKCAKETYSYLKNICHELKTKRDV